jgi:hypothetical protein
MWANLRRAQPTVGVVQSDMQGAVRVPAPGLPALRAAGRAGVPLVRVSVLAQRLRPAAALRHHRLQGGLPPRGAGRTGRKRQARAGGVNGNGRDHSAAGARGPGGAPPGGDGVRGCPDGQPAAVPGGDGPGSPPGVRAWPVGSRSRLPPDSPAPGGRSRAGNPRGRPARPRQGPPGDCGAAWRVRGRVEAPAGSWGTPAALEWHAGLAGKSGGVGGQGNEFTAAGRLPYV